MDQSSAMLYSEGVQTMIDSLGRMSGNSSPFLSPSDWREARKLKGKNLLVEQFQRQVDFHCPFAGNGCLCPEVMTPVRAMPSNREKKLFVMMNLSLAPTKNGCPRCSIFLRAWKEHVGAFGHFKYLRIWLTDSRVRESMPQKSL